MLLLMDRYDLYGKMAIPKHHNPQRDVPEIYRLAAMKRGIFVSTAALENFGLTFIEASAVGLPFVGTDKGGVRDIYENCESGILVDISNRKAIEEILYTLLTDTEQWQKLSENGVQHIRQVYNWKAHVDTYLSHLKTVLNNKKKQPALATRMGSIEHLLVCDIDNTLTGDRAAADELAKVLEAHHDRVGFAIATGRSFESAQEVLKHYSFPTPDILITAVGSEIHYGSKDVPDKGWTHYIRRRWKPDVIREVLSAFPELEMQNEEGTQRRYKISYTIKEGSEIPSLMERIRTALSEARSMQHLVLSHDTYLDILPYRASKGDAIHYIAWKWGIEASRVLTAGDSGNDRDMFSNPLRSIIVANHEESLNTIRKSKRVFFATKDSAAGVLEGLRHFKVIET
jgi:sucrose-phosphate synthase